MSIRNRLSKLEAEFSGENDTSLDHSVLELLVAEDVGDADLHTQSPKLMRELDRISRLILSAEQARGDQ